MAADLGDMSADDAARFAGEYDDHTYLYLRKNQLGWVRDAKFIPNCFDLDTANVLFAGHVEGAEVRLCAVLRGQVATVDEFEFADQPDVEAEPYASRLVSLDRRDGHRWFTVYGCWDTGDGPRRYSKRVEAVDAEHAELLVRRDKTAGEFLIAAVVEDWVPVEDVGVTWATLDGSQPAVQPLPENDDPSLSRPRWLIPAVAGLLVAVAVLLALLLLR
jgi:hypothetical protein